MPVRSAAKKLPWREAEAAVGTGKFLYKLEVPEFHDVPALVGVEKPVDFRLADWLLKGDARETLAQLLTRRGHAVSESESIAQARSLAKTRKFDIMICDLSPPDGGATISCAS